MQVKEFKDVKSILTTVLMVVNEPKLKVTKTGSTYLEVTLGDKTGSINCKKWNCGDELFNVIKSAMFVKIVGATQIYNDVLGVILDSIDFVSPNDVTLTDYIAESKRSEATLHSIIVGEISNNRTTSSKGVELLKTFINSDMYKDYCTLPAAKKMHHAYVRGLMEHSIEVLDYAILMATRAIQQGVKIDLDVIVVGALLHDVGKIEELQFTPGIKYTGLGNMIGHCALGMGIVDKLVIAAGSSLPEDFIDHVKHIIASHHLRIEWGAIKEPCTAEAIIIHQADMMSSKMNRVVGLKEQEINGWTRDFMLGDFFMP